MHNFPVAFFLHIDSKKVFTLIKHSVTKFITVISSVQYILAFISSFFLKECFPKKGFYENNIIVWYYQIRSKVVWKVMHGLLNYQNNNKNNTIMNKKSLLFFLCSYHSK